MDIESFPSLNKSEFAEACHYLDSKYCRATLGPLRNRWKLRLCTVLATSPFDEGTTTYIQITRPLEVQTDDKDDLSLELGNFTLSEKSQEEHFLSADKDMMDAEDSDEVSTLLVFDVLLFLLL